MHRTYIADIERGVRNITLRSMINLAAALQVSAAALLAEPGDLPPNAPVPQEVLLIEHDANDSEQVVRVFTESSLSNPITVIRDGLEALDYLASRGRYKDRPSTQSPQLILLDLGLPKVPALELLRRLKTDEATKTIPVVVLANVRDDKLILEAERIGADQHIVKPLAFEKFSQVIPKLKLHWAVVPRTAPNGFGH